MGNETDKPRLRPAFRERWLCQADGAAFMGVQLTDLSRSDLLCVAAFLGRESHDRLKQDIEQIRAGRKKNGR